MSELKIITGNSHYINPSEWSKFVLSHPNGNIFQTPEMFEIYNATDGYETILVTALNGSGQIVGILLAAIQKQLNGVLGSFVARSIINGGPLILEECPKILDALLSEYNRVAQKKAIYSQIRNDKPWDNFKKIFYKHGFIFEDHLNIIVDLSKPEDELWADVNSKRRNEIRRARKEGTSFSAKTSLDDLEESYNIIRSVYRRVKLPIPSFAFFKNIHQKSNENLGLTLFCAENESRVIGCMIALCYKETIFNYYAGAYTEHYKKYPNDLIPWEVFLWGKDNGFQTFDFGGAGKPNVPYGVREYKKKFGGKMVNFGRFENIHHPSLFQIAKTGFNLIRKLK